jgi:hypothetical protein
MQRIYLARAIVVVCAILGIASRFALNVRSATAQISVNVLLSILPTADECGHALNMSAALMQKQDRLCIHWETCRCSVLIA